MFGQQYDDVLNVKEACELMRIGRNGMYRNSGVSVRKGVENPQNIDRGVHR